MEQQRLLVYEIPHKAIRHALSQLSLYSGKTNYNDKSEMEKLNTIASETFAILKSHSEHENNVPLKHLETKRPGASNHDIEDHYRIEAEMLKLQRRLKELTDMSGEKEDLKYRGNDFYIQVSDFHSQYLQHMLEEERETQILMWENFSDEELVQHEIEIMSNISPEELLLWSKYMMPAFTGAGRV